MVQKRKEDKYRYGMHEAWFMDRCKHADPITKPLYWCLGATLLYISIWTFGLYNGCVNSVEQELLLHTIVVPCIFASYMYISSR